MLSICIPVFNVDVKDLVDDLYHQSIKANVPFEIILIDDCSREEFLLMDYSGYDGVKVVLLDRNIGRAKIRNLFMNYASYESLLFLDCDVKIESPDFIQKYIDAIRIQKNEVICGGRIFPELAPSSDYLLRWAYGKYKESQPLDVRLKNPNRSFQTNNFLVKKEVLKRIKFDERISEYGHEDTLFGFELKMAGISVGHIHNPVLNGDLETNREYLAKTENAIKNLVSITKFMGHNPSFVHDVTLLRVLAKLRKFGLDYLVLGLYITCCNPIRKSLVSGNPNLYLFDFYKLGYLIRESKR